MRRGKKNERLFLFYTSEEDVSKAVYFCSSKQMSIRFKRKEGKRGAPKTTTGSSYSWFRTCAWLR